MGILQCYHIAKGDDLWRVYDTTYFAIGVSLNVLLTLMIITRLALHIRNVRNAVGASSGLGGLYTAVITMLVESSALNAVGYLLYIVSVSTYSFAAFIFNAPLGETQVSVVFPFLQRIAIPGHRLINETDRPSLNSSSFYESQTELHWRAMLSPPGMASARSISGAEGDQLAFP